MNHMDRMKTIKNLLFDFGGVLVNLDRSRCLDHFRQLGVPHVETLLDVCHQQGVFLQHEKGLVSDAAFRDYLREQADNPTLTDGQLDDAWNSFLTDIPGYKLQALLELRSRYHVSLLSNTNGIHWQWSVERLFPYGNHRVNDYFEHIFLSYEMKLAKPDPAIFCEVLRCTGYVPEETLFLDDSAANCRAAEALGIRTYTPQAHEDWRSLFA